MAEEVVDKTSYKSPYYDSLDARTTETEKLPPGLLAAVRVRGEASNADQVSSAGAKTVYQIIEPTREAAIKKYGIDPYLSPENASKVAGRLLRESLDRNNGDVSKAVAEYHGGTDPGKWGPVTKSYVQRVTGQKLGGDAPAAAGRSTYDKVVEERAAGKPTSAIANVYDAYKAGRMEPEDKAAFEADVRAGRVLLPRGAVIAPITEKTKAAPEDRTMTAPEGVVNAWKDQRMTPAEAAEFETDVREGRLKVAPDVRKMIGDQPDIGSRAANAVFESISGARRETEQTRTLPEWTSSPELNSMSIASLKAGAGTMFAGPKEAMDIIKEQYPKTEIRQDEKGNYIFKSGIDGKEYAIPPGLTVGDAPRVIGALAAFTPTGRAAAYTTGARGAARLGAESGAVEGIIQGSQAATGGQFDTKDVALAAAGGAVIPPAARILEQALPPVVAAVRNRLPGAAERQAQAAVEARVMQGTAPPGAPVAAAPVAPAAVAAPPQSAPAASVAPEVSSAAPEVVGATAARAAENPLITTPKGVPSVEELGTLLKKAANGDKDAMQKLAAAADQDKTILDAAERLGMRLEPVQASKSQSFRELIQGVKSIPGANRTVELENAAHNAEKANELIRTMGGSNDLSDISARVKDTLTAADKQLKAGAKSLYDDLAAAVPKKTKVSIDDTVSYLKERAAELGGAKNLTPEEKSVLGTLVQKGKKPTYALLDQMRKDVEGAQRAIGGPFGSGDKYVLGKLGDALASDQQRVLEGLGHGATWEAAKATVRAYKEVQENLIDLFGKKLEGSIVGKLTQAMGKLSSGESSHFAQLVASIPKDMRQEVVASGLAQAFGLNAKNNAINFTTYAHWFEGLQRNTQARNALFSNLGTDAVRQLTDLYKVSKGISAASRERITTGRVNALLLGGESLTQRIYDLAKRSAAGAASEAITTPLGMPGAGISAAIASALTKGKPEVMKAADALLTSPEFAQAVKTGSKQDINRLARSSKFAALRRAAGNPTEMRDAEKWISTALQAQKEGKK